MQHLLDDVDGIVWSFDAAAAAFTHVSGGSRRLLGHEPRAWLEDADFRTQRLHAEDLDRVVDAFARVGSNGGDFDLTYRMRAADGSWRWFRDIGHATIGELGIVTRVQGLMIEAKPIEQAAPGDRFRSVVEHLSAIVYLEELPTGESAGRMLYVSPQVHEVLGFTQDEWLGDPTAWARQLHPEDRDRVRAIYERIETTGEPFRAEYRMYARDGWSAGFGTRRSSSATLPARPCTGRA